jgi:hypothetical protein
MILKPYSAVLKGSLPEDGFSLPLDAGDLARLGALIPEDEQMLLVLKDDLYREEILVGNVGYGPLILARGQGETTARRFPKGTCLSFEVTLSVVRWEICHYDCCAEAPCPGEPVAAAGLVLPPAQVGSPWEGTAIFSGTQPITIGAQGLPPWMTAETGPNYLRLSGTPDAAGVWQLSFAAANLAGSQLAIQTGTVVADDVKLMRHKNIKMTQRYAHLIPGQQREHLQIISRQLQAR